MIMFEMVGRKKFVHMKEISPEIKSILMSGISRNVKPDKILRDGLSEYVQKPFILHELSKVVVIVIDN